MCATCHTPHEKGVVEIDSPAGKQVSGSGADEGVKYEKSPWNEVFMADKKERLMKLA